MSTLREKVAAFFREQEWAYDEAPEIDLLRVNFTGQNGQWVCLVRCPEEERQVVFYSICPITVPQGKLGPAMEFLTRANFGLPVGNFELDLDDGEVRFKTSVDLEGAELVGPLIHQLVFLNVAAVDRYVPGLLAVLNGEATPAEALDRAEED